jgi:hypothetical protein
MMKLLTPALALSMGFALSSTAATAQDDGQKTVIRMVILGTETEDEGVFSANAISISAGVGTTVIGGYVENSAEPVVGATGAIGTAVFASSEDTIPEGSLTGFNTDPSPYETVVAVVCDPDGTAGCDVSGTSNEGN